MPYTTPTIILEIGLNKHEYKVSKSFLPSSLKDQTTDFWSSRNVITLQDLDEDIGHTFVHYLYTGSYQTLKIQGQSRDAELEREHRRSVLTYRTARHYGLDGLAAHAEHEVKKFGGDISIFHVLAACKDAYQSHSENDPWLLNYLRESIVAALIKDESLLTRDSFLEHIGEGASFARALVKIMGELYIEKASAAQAEAKNTTMRTLSCELQDQHPETKPELETMIAKPLSLESEPSATPRLRSSTIDEVGLNGFELLPR